MKKWDEAWKSKKFAATYFVDEIILFTGRNKRIKGVVPAIHKDKEALYIRGK